MKVLILDADWRFSDRASRYLEAHAHHVVHMTDNEDAMAQIAHWHPELVILSAELAEKDFLAALTILQDRPAVLLTERMDRYDRAWRAWQIGGDELLLKPVLHSADLHGAIVAALENRTSGQRCVSHAASA